MSDETRVVSGIGDVLCTVCWQHFPSIAAFELHWAASHPTVPSTGNSATPSPLTPDEWGAWLGTDSAVLPAGTEVDRVLGGSIGVCSGPEEMATISAGDCHAVAALCLHDQPFGFTWEDVDRLRRAAYNVPDGYSGNPWMEKLADRIAALLPPRQG